MMILVFLSVDDKQCDIFTITIHSMKNNVADDRSAFRPAGFATDRQKGNTSAVALLR